ncbi:MAG: hypothetical protein JXA92_13855 [candidate division Zixibacteria bacterium]|nr:hypothetical protein [candidate division Zixibacteria bacterium]
MTAEVSKPNRTLGLTFLFLSALLVVLFFYMGHNYEWSVLNLSGEIGALFMFVASLLYTFVKFSKKEVSLPGRRFGVFINYVSLALLLGWFYVAEKLGMDIALLAVGLALFVVVVVSFIIVHMRTRLWYLTHSPVDNLDERQREVTLDALRFSYSYFTVILLLLFLAFELLRRYSSGFSGVSIMPVIAVMIYTAHTLPAAILAWTEKEV